MTLGPLVDELTDEDPDLHSEARNRSSRVGSVRLTQSASLDDSAVVPPQVPQQLNGQVPPVHKGKEKAWFLEGKPTPEKRNRAQCSNLDISLR